ncbi:hypothetical protein ACJ73_03358 [Blastomyces percursus]|uniref:glutamate--tRNA ligase n=1 Tax=Blastomyces percursus TaxID=1658174 RepID=A0A1J9R9S8_9EURO|nr:hypothetical protein ACJ73_03358 [Blastomyces percursus]
MPTVRRIRRRGMAIPALCELILKQGPSRNVVNLDWTSLWTTNNKFIDPIAPRFTAIFKENIVVAAVHGASTAAVLEDRPKHAKNPSLDTKRVVYSSNLYFDQGDAALFKENEEITLMNWENGIISTWLGDVKRTEKKVTWLCMDQPLVPVELVDFEHVITKEKLEKNENILPYINWKSEFRSHGWADCNVSELAKDDIIQFERKGYYCVDRAYHDGLPAVLFNIPTGKTN